MKVAIATNLYESIPPHSKNGLEFLVYYLAEELVKRGNSPVLFSTADSIVNGAEIVPITPYGYSLDEDPNLRKGYAWEFMLTMFAIDQVNKRDDIDILHLNYLFPDLVSNFCKKPIIRTYHHNPLASPFKETKKYFEEKFLKPGRKLYEGNKGIFHVFVSKRQKELMQDYYKEIYNFTDENSRVIYNGIPTDEFKFNPNPEDYFLYFAYITPDKGADIAVDIARKTGIKLKISGVYDKSNSFFDEKIKPYLNSKIEYIGPVAREDRSELLGKAKALLFPNRWEEPFGLTVVEAMACGTPVIAGIKGSMTEIVQHSRTGFVTDNNESLMSAVKMIDQIDRKVCGNYVRENFSVEKMTDGYSKLYEELVNRK